MTLLNKIATISVAATLSVASLFAAPADDLKAGSPYEIGADGTTSGFYQLYDSTNSMWFLYMPASSYLLVHETGKSAVADGAKVLSVSDFSSIDVSGSTVTFGTYSGSEAEGSDLAGQSYDIGTGTSGFYNLYDSTSNMWFLYMPASSYLLVHETGKSAVADGAQTVDVTEAEADYDGATVTFGTVDNTPDDDPTNDLDDVDAPPAIGVGVE